MGCCAGGAAVNGLELSLFGCQIEADPVLWEDWGLQSFGHSPKRKIRQVNREPSERGALCRP